MAVRPQHLCAVAVAPELILPERRLACGMALAGKYMPLKAAFKAAEVDSDTTRPTIQQQYASCCDNNAPLPISIG